MATFPVKVRGADRHARGFATTAAQLESELDKAQDELGDRAELVYAAHALRKTGRLARGIVARRAGGGVLVTATARNPTSGYDYVGVTRFGHRKAKIVPRHDRAPASTISTKTGRATKRRAALRFSIGGKVLYRRSVSGFHPASDWADRALPQVKAQAHLVAARLGRRIEEMLA